MEELKGKKVLFIGTTFFNYHVAIKKELENRGSIVDFYNEIEDCFERKFYRAINKKLLSKFDEHYHQKLLRDIQAKSYDYLFVLHGEGLTESLLSKIKSLNKNIIFIMYQWDSIIHFDYTHLIPCFDKVFTFDDIDANKYGINFLPLFYIHEYKTNSDNKISDIIYDVAFIGSLHSDRYQIIKRIIDYSSLNELNFFHHLYISKLSYLKQKYLHRKRYSDKYLKFHTLNKDKIFEVIEKSNCILDINEKGQNGLTIRTFEMMVQNKKIITTNQNIKNYEFYDENSILVIDRESGIFNTDFIKNKISVKYKNLDKYSLSNWISTLFRND